MIEYIILFALFVCLTAAGYFIGRAGTKETSYEEAKGTHKWKGRVEKKDHKISKKSVGKQLKKQKEPEKVSLASNIVKEALSNYKKPQHAKSHEKETTSDEKQVIHTNNIDKSAAPKVKQGTASKEKSISAVQEKPTPGVKTKPTPGVKTKPTPGVKEKPASGVKEKPASAVKEKPASADKEKSTSAVKEKHIAALRGKNVLESSSAVNKRENHDVPVNKKGKPATTINKENITPVKDANPIGNKKVNHTPVDKEILAVNKKENSISSKKEKVLPTAEVGKSKIVKKQMEPNKHEKVDVTNTEHNKISRLNQGGKTKRSQNQAMLNGDLQQVVEKAISVENSALEKQFGKGKSNHEVQAASNKKSAPAPNKPKNAQAQEVSSGEAEQIMIITQQMQEAKKSAESKMKKKPKEKAVVAAVEANSLNNILSLIQGARLKSAEIQIMIDLLLNRQNESNIKGGEWVEMGRIDPLTQLRKQLDDTENRLKEENDSKAALSEKIISLRVDLKNEKISSSNLKKQLEQTSSFMQQKLQETIQANNEQMNLKLKDLNVSLERNFQTQMMQQKQTLQVEYDGQLQHINAIHAETEQQLQQYCHKQAECDVQLQKSRATITEYEQRMQPLEAAYNETEKQCQVAVQGRDELAQTCQQYQQHIASLTDQNSQKEAAMSRQLHELQSNLKASENARTQALTQFSQVTGEREQLMQQVSNLENIRELFSQNQNKLQSAIKDKVESECRFNKIDNELSSVREIAKNQMIKIDELQKEKEELASQAFRPAADGQENGDSHEKNENIVNKNLNAMYEENISSLSNEVSKLKEMLDTRTSKCKNEISSYEDEWKNMRETLGRIFPAILLVAVDDKAALVKKVEEETKKVVEKKPEVIEKVVKIPEEEGVKYKKLKDENEDLMKKVIELEVEKTSLSDKLSEITTAPKPVDNSAKLTELTEENKTLNDKVTGYMCVLAKTESLLESLQVSVEKEEKSWKERMAEKDTEVKQLSAEKSNLLVKIEELKVIATSKTDDSSEINCLKAKLEKEQEQNQKLSNQLESQSQSSTIPEAVNSNGIESHEGKFSPEDSTSLLSNSSVSEVVGSTAQSSSKSDGKKKKKKKK